MGLFRELRYELSSLIFGLGILGMIFSLTQYLIPVQSPDWLQSIHRAVGNYVVWEAFLGFLAVLGGGFYFVDTIRKEREFERLLSTPSKEVFVKNMGRTNGGSSTRNASFGSRADHSSVRARRTRPRRSTVSRSRGRQRTTTSIRSGRWIADTTSVCS